MSQKCSECGRETQFGKPLEHHWGCEHDTAGTIPLLSRMGEWPQQKPAGFLLTSKSEGE